LDSGELPMEVPRVVPSHISAVFRLSLRAFVERERGSEREKNRASKSATSFARP